MTRKTVIRAIPNETIGSHEPHPWKPHLDSYQQLQAITFESYEQLEKALELIWSQGHALFGLPRDIIDGITMCVPKEAVQYFEEAGLSFQVSDVK